MEHEPVKHKGNVKPGVELFVKEFNSEQQRRFISQWYLAQEINIRKEIYEDLGGTREYNEEVFENFGDRVGTAFMTD